jgi:hypothetical protein
MNKYKVKMYESLDDMKEGYLIDKFLVISDEDLSDKQIKQACVERRSENEEEKYVVEDYVWDIEFYSENIEIIDLTSKGNNNES